MKQRPYIIGSPVSGSAFYNREDILDELCQLDGQNYFLNGIRRIGKTSILLRIQEILSKKENFYPVFTSLEGCFSDEEMGMLLQIDIENVLLSKGKKWNFVKKNVTLSVIMSKWINYCVKYGFNSIIMIDEIEKLHDLSKESHSKLIKVFTRPPQNIKFIVAGTRNFTQPNHNPEFPSLSGLFKYRYIGHLSFESAVELIRQSHEEIGNLSVSVFEEQIETIYTNCAGHPYLIQFICDKLLKKDTVDKWLLQETAQISYSDLEIFFIQDYNLITTEQQNILKQLALNQSMRASSLVDATGMTERAVIVKTEELKNLGFIFINDGMYSISYQLFKDWIYDTHVNVRQDTNPALGNSVSEPLETNKLRIVTIFAADIYDIFEEYKHNCMSLLHEYFEHWDIEELLAGGDIMQTYIEKIKEADIIVGLLSSGFFLSNSDTAIVYRENILNKKTFIPVLAKDFFTQAEASLNEVTILPQTNGIPLAIEKWQYKSEAYTQISEKLFEIKKSFHP